MHPYCLNKISENKESALDYLKKLEGCKIIRTAPGHKGDESFSRKPLKLNKATKNHLVCEAVEETGGPWQKGEDIILVGGWIDKNWTNYVDLVTIGSRSEFKPGQEVYRVQKVTNIKYEREKCPVCNGTEEYYIPEIDERVECPNECLNGQVKVGEVKNTTAVIEKVKILIIEFNLSGVNYKIREENGNKSVVSGDVYLFADKEKAESKKSEIKEMINNAQ